MKMTDIELYSAKCDIYGNPRVIVHFLTFVKPDESNLPIEEQYRIAHKRAKYLGFRKYKGRDFGGGFVCQCWSGPHLKNSIIELMNKA